MGDLCKCINALKCVNKQFCARIQALEDEDITINQIITQITNIINNELPVEMQNVGCRDENGNLVPPNPNPASNPPGNLPPLGVGEVYYNRTGTTFELRRIVSPNGSILIETTGPNDPNPNCIELTSGCDNVFTVRPGDSIQDAINDANAIATAQDRPIVYICPGTYTEDLTMFPNITMKGATRDTVFIQAVSINSVANVTYNGGGDITIEDITFLARSQNNAFGNLVTGFLLNTDNGNGIVTLRDLRYFNQVANSGAGHEGNCIRASGDINVFIDRCDFKTRTTTVNNGRRGSFEFLDESKMRAYHSRFINESNNFVFSAPVFFIHDRAIKTVPNTRFTTDPLDSNGVAIGDIYIRFSYIASNVANVRPTVKEFFPGAGTAPNGNHNNVNINYNFNQFRPAMDIRDNVVLILDHVTYVKTSPYGFGGTFMWVHDGTRVYMNNILLKPGHQSTMPVDGNPNVPPNIIPGGQCDWLIWSNYEAPDINGNMRPLPAVGVTANNVPFLRRPVVIYGNLNIGYDEPTGSTNDFGDQSFRWALSNQTSERIHSIYYLDRVDNHAFVANLDPPPAVITPPLPLPQLRAYGTVETYQALSLPSDILSNGHDSDIHIGGAGAAGSGGDRLIIDLTRDLYCKNLYISPGSILRTHGFRIFCRNQCFIDSSTADGRGVIEVEDPTNQDAVGGTPGTGAGITGAIFDGTLGSGSDGGTPGNVGGTSTNIGGIGTNYFYNQQFGLPNTEPGPPVGGTTSVGGDGGGLVNGGTTIFNQNEGAQTLFMNPTSVISGRTLDGARISGGAGGGGGSNVALGGGAGGGGGGVIMIVAHTILGTGLIRANGGNGSDATVTGDGGGGGGGGGHVILMAHQDLFGIDTPLFGIGAPPPTTPPGIIEVNGGNGGLGAGGPDGVDGAQGFVSRVHIH